MSPSFKSPAKNPAKGFALRIAALAIALVVGPATLAPGTAEAPTPSRAALAGDGATAARTFHWGLLQWDFAWEFGESLDSPPYKGPDIRVGRWEEYTNGTGRAVKFGGGVEFHSGDKIKLRTGPDRGDSWLTLRDQPAVRGRWEIKERADKSETGLGYRFVIELIPDDLTANPCQRSITIADVTVGDNSLRIGATAGSTKWTKTFADGYQQDNQTNYNFALQVTRRRITWFANGKAIASTGDAAALPTIPMTLRMRMLGQGDREMAKSTVKVDWVRHYDLTRGDTPPNGAALTKGTNVC